MAPKLMIAALALILAPISGVAQDGPVRMFVPGDLVDTGLLRHILPRFSLKTQVRVALVDDPAQAQVIWGQTGAAIFDGLGATWRMDLPGAGHAGTDRFADWVRSDIGLRTITSFQSEGQTLFTPPTTAQVTVEQVTYDGDADRGLAVSRQACARCHAVEDAGRKNDIGSTPSFFVLRAFEDWQGRFAAFYALNPHPAFTQITDVTDPFPQDRPSPIHPVELSIEDLEAVISYVALLRPADLGAPLTAQEF